jgi:1-acyl-sn-glycerol-3-phosphate acyltransferase
VTWIYSVVTSFLVILVTMLASVVTLLLSVFDNRKWEDLCVLFWCRSVLWLADVTVQTRGFENLPPIGQGVIYVFNHASLFDIPVLHGILPRSFRFGAKAELFKIPLFGWAIKKGRALKIERANLSSVIKVYEVAKHRVALGESFILAPEGTRQAGDQIGHFKTGPFILAIQANATVVPVVLKGVEKILPRNKRLLQWGIKDRSVQLQVLKPIATSGLTLDDRSDLRDRVQKAMEDAFREL